jgi:phosphonopyruvate decarboxylase
MIAVKDAVAAVLAAVPDALVVSTCGYITRDLHEVADRPENFYLVGSMGMAAPIGLGVALARPGRRVVVLDGDGSFAMNLGALPMVAGSGADVVHVVLDNGRHESTGGQRTSGVADPVGLALASGYRAAYRVTSVDEIAGLDLSDAPVLVHAVCAPRDYAIGRRVTHTPAELVARFGAAAAREVA